MSSQAAVQISRGALLALSAGAGSMWVFSNERASDGLVPQYLRKIMWEAAGRPLNSVPGQGGSPELSALTQQLTDLNAEVARLRLQAQYGGYAHGGRSSVSWTTVITVGGVGLLVFYIKGYSFDDIMYVTKQALSTAVQALEAGLDNVGIALETAKRELTYKLGIVEEKMDSMEAKLSDEVGQVRRELENVGDDIKGVSRAQKEVHGLVENIETQMDGLEHKMADANSALSTANKGIYLLCNVVAENMGVAAKASNNSNNNVRGRASSLYDDLIAYTRSYVTSFKGGAPPPSSSSTLTAEQQELSPAAALLTDSSAPQVQKYQPSAPPLRAISANGSPFGRSASSIDNCSGVKMEGSLLEQVLGTRSSSFSLAQVPNNNNNAQE